MASKERTYKIGEIIEETPTVKTFLFDYKKDAEPGQFLMVWVPGEKEIPMSVSRRYEDRLGITVKAVGESTKKLHSFETGDYIGVRGPYGTSFESKGDNIAVVAGGCGAAPVDFFVKSLAGENIKAHVLLGADTEEELLFKEEFEKVPYADLHCATDDGSCGHEGFVTEIFETLIENEKFDCTYACGPEVMLKKVYELCSTNNIDMQASLERYMKCGIGICGSCAIDDYLVCKDGPVFGMEDLNQMSEFGEKKRNKAGSHVEI